MAAQSLAVIYSTFHILHGKWAFTFLFHNMLRAF